MTKQQIALGVLSATISNIFEHPLDVCKLRLQKDDYKGYLELIKIILQEKGGLYQGATASFTKRIAREGYRFPALNGMRWVFDHYKIKGPAWTRDMSCAGVLSVLDVAIGLPIDRLVTAAVNERGYHYYFNKDLKGAACLYRGAHAAFGKAFLGWSIFMITNYQMKKVMEGTPFAVNQLFTGLAIATTNIVCTQPFDFAKVRLQMDPDLAGKKSSEVAWILFQRYGLRGFYSGGGPAFMRVLSHALLIGPMINTILH